MENQAQTSRIYAIELAITGIIMALENIPKSEIGPILKVIRDHRAMNDPESDETKEVLGFFDAMANL